jgi:hypothetical protein
MIIDANVLIKLFSIWSTVPVLILMSAIQELMTAMGFIRLVLTDLTVGLAVVKPAGK